MSNVRDLARQATVQDELLSRSAARSLYAFSQVAWPILEPTTPFLPNWHLECIADHLEAVTAGQISRLLINAPPRSAKSLVVSVFWPVWEWISDPSRRFLCVSYGESLAIKLSVDRRTLLLSPWFQRHWRHVRLTSDQNEKAEFLNTRRGAMIATSIGGPTTGKGGNRIIVDDPHNPEHVHSAPLREHAIQYFNRTLSTRLDHPRRDAIVVVGQRVHEQDLSQHCLELGYTSLCLPAEVDLPTTVIFPRAGRTHVRPAGDLLCPAREGRAELDRHKQTLGSAAYSAQYLQRPVPEAGLMFQRSWFRFYTELPPGCEWVQSWDMSFKGGPHNDWVVGLVGARRGADVYLVDRAKGQWTFTETCRQVQALAQRYANGGPILVEDAANGAAIIDALRGSVRGLVSVSPQGGKMTRAQAVAPNVEAGNVYLPDPRPHGVLDPGRRWVEDFLHQLTTFPQGAHDDDVDAFSQLLLRWQRQSPRARRWGTR